ncbi:uncharacterized protein LOC144762880 [Lissotriton helveticus]
MWARKVVADNLHTQEEIRKKENNLQGRVCSLASRQHLEAQRTGGGSPLEEKVLQILHPVGMTGIPGELQTDDAVLIARTQLGLQRALNTYIDFMDNRGLRLNVKKTFVMSCGKEPRGKQKAGTESAGEPQAQSSSTEDPAAVPSAEPVPSTSADGDSGAASAEAIPEGTGGPEAPTPEPAAVGEDPTAVGDVTPSKPTRKELAVRARQRKLQAIVEAYRRLVAQAEEEEEAAAAAAASSNAPAPKPAGVRRRGQAAARRRIFSSSAAPPQHACQCRCRDFQKKILLRVARLEDEMEERVKLIVDKHLKARRL